MPPSTYKALVTRTEGESGPELVKKSLPVPTPGEHQVLVKIIFTAQNPTDVQSFDGNVFGDDAVLGCDFVGTVEATGPGVTKVRQGMTIAGLVWGGEIAGLGAYCGYTIADDRICFPIPEGASLEQASTIPLAATTAWLALFSKDCLNIDRKAKDKEPILIWGGSSSVGNYATQIATMYGHEVIATCSPRNTDFVRSLGAKHVFDYNDEKVVENIREAAPKLRLVFDTIGGPTSSETASRAIDPEGGALCTVRPGKANTENVTEWTRVTDVLVWTAFLKEHRYGKFYWPVHKEDHELASELFEKLPEWLRGRKIKPNNVIVLDGLDDVAKGFQMHRDGKISGYKIVVGVFDS
ncbi:probable zinc-binding oxidoreductase [Cephalotrichum gorgonifer]|uniref:Probable zinc-binding oxidoreductase n=1 Tax=Cephalotrichum gorgonifer TaxID=2041049 RepID=A0AAE8N759_9PEZI|nr:probable zinc-binding oxidoreductase [Cephalotrichum gorgonifer]